MIAPPSDNTKAVLLLTAPLIVGRNTTDPELLSGREYNRLAQHLHSVQAEPADLLRPVAADLVASCEPIASPDRLRRLLDRGLLLGQAVEHWQVRAIQVVSRADPDYPRRWKERLRGSAPALLYSCGDLSLLDTGGLAVVGSRNVDEALADYTTALGMLAANAGATIVSGGARGIDQAAMRGALEAGGRVCGVLADSLERQVMVREHRDMLLDGRLVFVSPYDPKAGFNVGHAIARNKLIYALADGALVVSSDLNKGGTWAGAVEQLEKLNFVPVHVRAMGASMPGLDALRSKGAHPWPEPADADGLREVLRRDHALDAPAQLITGNVLPSGASVQPAFEFDHVIADGERSDAAVDKMPDQAAGSGPTPAEILFDGARRAIEEVLTRPMKAADIARAMDLSANQARSWLTRLVESGDVGRQGRSGMYMLPRQSVNSANRS